jgi:hypothetical protein
MPEANLNQPATRADVHALEVKMEGRLQKLEDKIVAVIQSGLAQAKAELTASLQEFVRDSQTELLRGFQAYATGFDTRLAKFGANLSNLDQATERRLSTLERRLLEIETRIPPMAPLPPAS